MKEKLWINNDIYMYSWLKNAVNSFMQLFDNLAWFTSATPGRKDSPLRMFGVNTLVDFLKKQYY